MMFARHILVMKNVFERHRILLKNVLGCFVLFILVRLIQASIWIKKEKDHEIGITRADWMDLPKTNEIHQQQAHDVLVHQEWIVPSSRDVINALEEKILMRIDLPNTEHQYPWGKDKYNTTDKCRQKKYDHSKLPAASVIIGFHESERLEYLLHTVHSVVQNSPPELLGEVILVDDNSHTAIYEEYLPKYVEAVFGDKVRVIKHHGNELLGVIGARILGISFARSPVVVVLDAHMEAQPGWLESLLEPISQDRRTLASISNDWMKRQPDGHWVYEHGPSDPLVAWFWESFQFMLWEQESPENTKRLQTDPTQPFLNPCTIGHWAMDRTFFSEIGGLDPGMKLWGGENVDIAIRTYLWDGQVLGIPCSHVGHVEDNMQRALRSSDPNFDQIVNNNYKRIVEVWLDEYKNTFYYYNPQIQAANAGNLTERMEFKARCPNTFKTFLKRGFPQLGHHYGRHIARGGLKCVAKPTSTMYWENPWTFGMLPTGYGRREIFLTIDGYLRYDLAVFNAQKDRNKGQVLFTSHTTFKTGSDTRWLHKQGGVIRSLEYSTFCMQCDEATIQMALCDETDPRQQWNFDEYTSIYKSILQGQLKKHKYHVTYHRYLSSYKQA